MELEVRIQVIPVEYYFEESSLPDDFPLEVNEFYTIPRIKLEAFRARPHLFEEYARTKFNGEPPYDWDARYDPTYWIVSLLDLSTKHWPLLPDAKIDIVLETGEVYFRQPIEYVTLSDLCRSVEEGVGRYSCNTIGFTPIHEGGANGEDYVTSVLDTWPLFEAFLKYVGFKVLAKSAVGALALLCNKWRQWRRKRAKPRNVLEFIKTESSWTLSLLGLRLGMEREETRVVLEGLGYKEYAEHPSFFEKGNEGESDEFARELDTVGAKEWWMVLPVDIVPEIAKKPRIYLPNDWLIERLREERQDNP